MITVFLTAGIVTCYSSAEATINSLGISGDFRGRLESDWDSSRSDGTRRDDRLRLRIRARIAMEYRVNKYVSFGARIRSGSNDSQQSPHITILDFDDNPNGDAHFNFDKWYLKYTFGDGEVWLGRNSIPFWRPDELVIDDDVTPAGFGFVYEWSNFTFNAGYFTNPAGIRDFTGNTGVAQVVYNTGLGNTNLTFSGGIVDIKADPENPANHLLLDSNGKRDYTLWIGNAQASLTVLNNRPLLLQVELIHNSKSYWRDDSDSFTSLHRKERDGYVLSAVLGDTDDRNHWQLGYFYSYLKTFAVNNSYTQDDWLRWGSATQTRTSNFKWLNRAVLGRGLSDTITGFLGARKTPI